MPAWEIDNTSLSLRHIAVIGDVHAEDVALEKALLFLRETGSYDALLCTGDVVTGPGDAGRCCALLIAHNIYTIRGNHDRWFFQPGYFGQMPNTTPREQLNIQQTDYLSDLPVLQTFSTPIGNLMLCHGTGGNDMLAVYPGDQETFLSANPVLQTILAEQHYAVMIGGHTHRRMVRQVGKLLIINAGTLRRDHQPCFLTIDFIERIATFFDIDPVTEQITAGQGQSF